MNSPITKGIHHFGLTVSHLEESADFFISLLGWKEVRRNLEYPAIYVSDGMIMISLWALKENPCASFNKDRNVGLHHVAFQVESEAELNRIHDKLAICGTPIEFAPEPLGKGSARHMMCLEPSGIRVEFTWPGN
jgi:catechol 2,3-dioxygenase-like lactoylglutathione lyase family enzyme